MHKNDKTLKYISKSVENNKIKLDISLQVVFTFLFL